MITTATDRTATADDDNEHDDHDKGKARDDDGRTKDKTGWNKKSRLGDNGWAPAWPRGKHGVNIMCPGQQTSSTDQRGRPSLSLFCYVSGFL